MYSTQGLRCSIQQSPNAIASVYKGRCRTFAELGERDIIDHCKARMK